MNVGLSDDPCFTSVGGVVASLVIGTIVEDSLESFMATVDVHDYICTGFVHSESLRSMSKL